MIATVAPAADLRAWHVVQTSKKTGLQSCSDALPLAEAKDLARFLAVRTGTRAHVVRAALDLDGVRRP